MQPDDNSQQPQDPDIQAPLEDDVMEDTDATEPVDSSEIDYAQESADALVSWQAPEYIHKPRSAGWFVVLGLITAAIVAVALFLMESISFAILAPVMAAALVIYVLRPPAIVNYSVSRKGVHVNDKLYVYSEFRAFSVMTRDNSHAVMLVPRKRFQMGQTLYFPEEVGEPLVDMLAARLPMQTAEPDIIDKFLAKLHL